MRRLAFALHRDVSALRSWDAEDLYQEAFLKAMLKLEGFRGEASLKSWAIGVAKNHLLDQARHLKHSPTAVGDAVSLIKNRRENDADERRNLRHGIRELLGWLRKSPDGVTDGWEVLNLLAKSGGNLDYTATAMTLHQGQPWTVERVRNVVRKIKVTAKGRALCEAVGIISQEDESKRSDRHGS